MKWYGRCHQKLTENIFRSEKPEGKKIRETYDNEGLTHAWASENVPRGRSSRMFFENGLIYSYGHHFKAAKIYTNTKGEKLVLINNSRYSSSTTGHIEMIRRAVSHLHMVDVPNVDVTHDPHEEDHHARNVEHLEERVWKCFEGILSMKGWNGSGNTFLEYIGELDRYQEFFGLTKSFNLTDKNVQLTADLLEEMYLYKAERAEAIREKRNATLEQKHAVELAEVNRIYRVKMIDFIEGRISQDELRRYKWAAKEKVCFGNIKYRHLHAEVPADLREAYQAKIERINADMIEAWKRGEIDRIPWNMRSKYAFLRVRDNKVETSQGVDVPLTHALRLLGVIERGQARKGERVGHYTLEKLESLKDVPPVVEIGCHKILLSEAQSVLASYRNEEVKIVEN